jgi:hypothetical protein
MLVIALLYCAALATVWYLPAHPFVDEYAHWPQAQSFARGSWALDPGISTWPTMNAIVGWTLALLGQSESLVAGRQLIASFACVAIAGFLALAREFDADAARLRTAQFFLSPIVLPFCALIYTDLPALSALIWAAVGALRRQAWLLIGAGFLACAMRQNNIVWFAGLLVLYGWLTLRAGERVRFRYVAASLAVIGGWLAVVWLQGGVASGAYTRGDHPGALRGIPNIWFACFVAALVYAPYLLHRLLREPDRLPLWQYTALGVIVLLTFRVTHRFNFVDGDYFIHNLLLAQSLKPWGFGVLLLVVVPVALLLVKTPLAKHQGMRISLLLLSAVSLLPLWLIEQRYYLPIYALFWAARMRVDDRVEYAQLLFGGLTTVWMVVRIANGTHFV